MKEFSILITLAAQAVAHLVLVRPLVSSADLIESKLRAAFPARRIAGVITPHECEECAAIRAHLKGCTWVGVDDQFAEKYSGSLPLLSPEAYNAYLPVWLRAALHNPDGDAASMVLINLAHDPPMEHFTRVQAQAVLDVAAFVATNNYWGADDPENINALRAVERAWASRAA